jgi:hypothetical protein
LLKRLQQNCANVGKMYKAITLKNVDYNFWPDAGYQRIDLWKLTSFRLNKYPGFSQENEGGVCLNVRFRGFPKQTWKAPGAGSRLCWAIGEAGHWGGV